MKTVNLKQKKRRKKKKMKTEDYQQQAKDALSKCGATMTIKLSNTKECPWEDDTQKRDHNHYRVTIKTLKGQYTFDFWGSANDCQQGRDPSEYDVLACLEYNTPESFEEFCSEYGYDTDSRKAEKTWKACLRQSKALRRIFTESAIELLQEIR